MQCGPADGDEVGAAGEHDRGGVVLARDAADGDGRDADVVADPLGERGLVAAPVGRVPRGATTSPLETSIAAAPCAAIARAISTASAIVVPPSAQSTAEMRTSSGLLAASALRTASSTSSGKRSRAVSVAAVAVGAQVGQRGEEGREQVPVPGLQLEDVEAGLVGALGRGGEFLDDPAHLLLVSSWVAGRPA